MLPSSTAAEQLREARARIAVLELELARLRSASPAIPPTRPAPLKPRPAIMTRRASAAAAAAAAAVSAVASDLTRRPPPSPRLAPAPPSRSSSALSSMPGESSELSRGASELSETTARQPEQVSSPCRDAVREGSGRASTPAPVFEAVTPEMAAAEPGGAAGKVLSRQDRKFLSARLARQATPAAPAAGKVVAAVAAAGDGARPGNGGAEERVVLEKGDGQRRRPPPLPVVKNASTKKERYHVMAKCTEPKPGQTRYWTEEEHERFLEAVAEYGEKAYVAISNYVETRTPKQVRTHAQKFQMKMARLARQSIDAGEPVQMPAGMSPVVQLCTDGKPTLVPLHHATGQNDDSAGSLGKGLPGHVPVVVTVPPPKSGQGKKRSLGKSPAPALADQVKQEDALAKVSSNVTEESSSALTDPYMDYIGAASETKVEMELENTFAAKLCQTLQGSASDAGSKGEFLMSDGSSNDSGSTGDDDDDLEDLENLEDGDLSLAPFSNPTETWLLPDSSGLSVV